MTALSRPSSRAIVSALISFGAVLRDGVQLRPARALTLAGADGRTLISAADAGEARHGIAMHGAERNECADEGTAAWAAQGCHEWFQ